MQIKKINAITNFGVFENFSWPAPLPEFSLFNAIYGWNYSGKTTLSRIFRAFELGENHSDFEHSTFAVRDGDNIDHNISTITSPFPIRVFNSDFIENNLKWNASIEPFFILGTENITLQERREELTSQKDIKKFRNLFK